MPHVIVKMAAGRTDAEKGALAQALAQVLMERLSCTEDQISIAVQDIKPGDWKPTVYLPDILGHPELLFKKPNYQLD